MRRLRIARQAYADLDAIADFIRRDNPDRAESFVNEIADKIAQIVELPLAYPERTEWRSGLRSGVHGRYLILFLCDDGEVAVLRVLHGARDIAGMFMGDED